MTCGYTVIHKHIYLQQFVGATTQRCKVGKYKMSDNTNKSNTKNTEHDKTIKKA